MSEQDTFTGDDGQEQQVKSFDDFFEEAIAVEQQDDGDVEEVSTQPDTASTGDTQPAEQQPEQDYKSLYEKEVQRTKSWDGRLSAKDRELQELRHQMTAMEQRINAAAQTQQTQEQSDELDESVKGFLEEFPELAKPIQKMIDKAAARYGRTVADDVTQRFEQRLESTLKPIATTVQETSVERHLNTIKSAHNDFEDIVRSGALQEWIGTQPRYMIPALQAVYDRGQAQDVVDLIGQYKSATQKQATPQQDTQQRKPAAAVRSRQHQAPLNRQDKIPEDDFDAAWAAALRKS